MLVLFWIAAAYALVRVIGYGVDPVSTRRYHVEAAWFFFAAVGWITAAIGSRGRVVMPPREDGPTLTARDGLVLLGALLAIVFLCYGPSLGVGLLSDDFSLVQRADHWTIFSTAQSEFFRPVPLLLWAIVRRVSHDVLWLHALNLAVHALNGYLLALLALRIGITRTPAVASAVLFVTFPAHVEAVTWISGLQDLAMTCACLVYLLLTIGEPPNPARGTGSLVVLAIALLSKETAVIAPVLAVLLTFLSPAPNWRRSWIWIAAGLAVAGAYALWRITALPPPAGYDQAVTRYFGKELLSRTYGTLAVPWSDMVLRRASWIGVISGVFALIVAVVGVLVSRLDRTTFRRATILVVWSLVAVVPVYSYFFISPSLQGSRYLYLPACGWMLFVSAAAFSTAAFSGRWLLTVAGMAIAVAAIAGVAGTRWHQRPWAEAAGLRDRVLADVMRLGDEMRCTAAETDVADLPDATNGAYVFRNGFREALAATLPGTTSLVQSNAPGPSARCRFRWTERGLVAQRPSAH